VNLQPTGNLNAAPTPPPTPNSGGPTAPFDGAAQNYTEAEALAETDISINTKNRTAAIKCPTSVVQTGLSERFLADLLSKHLYTAGVINAREIGQRMALGGPIIEQLLHHLRREARIEVRANHSMNAPLCYGLTERGRTCASDAFAKSGYLGPCPVPLEQYCAVSQSQSIHLFTVTQSQVKQVFGNFVLCERIKDQLGMAVNSSRAIFIYGPAGSGKTYTISQLPKIFGDGCLIPYAVAIDDTVIELFDPLIHISIETHQQPADTVASSDSGLLLEQQQDSRWLACQRPVVICGGELTMDMLNINYNPSTRQYQAPLQMKANGGILIIDDMGRQKPSPAEIFNRWIVPMEEHRDFLSLGSGRHFEVPFDQILIFSSNLNPLELADAAFLRRIGYKIRFEHIDTSQYQAIWLELCEKHAIKFNLDAFNYLVTQLHQSQRVPMLPCHPRDLLGIAMDHARYHASEEVMTRARIDWAWQTYFVDTHVSTTDHLNKAPSIAGEHND